MKAEKNLKMQHYFYHCEKNPGAFNRLKIENFERETIERTIEEEKEILKSSGDWQVKTMRDKKNGNAAIQG